jgi:hypothetical protein
MVQHLARGFRRNAKPHDERLLARQPRHFLRRERLHGLLLQSKAGAGDQKGRAQPDQRPYPEPPRSRPAERWSGDCGVAWI